MKLSRCEYCHAWHDENVLHLCDTDIKIGNSQISLNDEIEKTLGWTKMTRGVPHKPSLKQELKSLSEKYQLGLDQDAADYMRPYIDLVKIEQEMRSAASMGKTYCQVPIKPEIKNTWRNQNTVIANLMRYTKKYLQNVYPDMYIYSAESSPEFSIYIDWDNQ